MTEITTAVQAKRVMTFINGNEFSGVSGGAMTFVDLWDAWSADVLEAKKFEHNRGIFGILPTNCVGTPGTFHFSLKNDITNSGGKAGYYSFEHDDVRFGFEKGIEIRVGYTFDGSTTYHWRGRLYDATPMPDPKDPYVDVICYGWLMEAQEQKFKATEVAVDQRGDQAVQTMLDILPNSKQPIETSLDTGQTTFPYVFDSERDEKTSVISVFQKAAQSEIGKVYVNAGSSGEQLVFENSQHYVTESVVQYMFDNSISDIHTSYPERLVKTVIQVVVHPREIDLTDVVLGQVQKSFSIGGGVTKEVTLYFRDPNGVARVSSASLAARVSGTDYVARANEDGTGADRTSDMTVAVATDDDGKAKTSGNSITLSIKNTAGTLFWVTVMQQKGKGIYMYDPLPYEARSSDAIIRKHGERVLRFDMTYADDYNTAVNTADALLTTWQELICQVKGLTFYPERSDALAEAFLDIDIGKRISVYLPRLGIYNDYFIANMSVSRDEGLVACTYGLAPTPSGNVCILDDTTYGVLDSEYARVAL